MRTKLHFTDTYRDRRAKFLLGAFLVILGAHVCNGLHARPKGYNASTAVPTANTLLVVKKNAGLNHGMPILVLNPQSISFTLGNSAQLEVKLENGPLSHATTITWSYEGVQQLLSTEIPPLTIPAGVETFSAKYTILNNASSGRPGVVTIIAHQSTNSSDADLSLENAYSTISIYRADWINVVSSIFGWIYFASWTLSFYPQMWINFRRKSVVGLSFDFLALNVIGFSCYTAFNAALFWATVPRAEYRTWHPYSQIQVEPNDVAFGFHAVFITLVTIGQCFIYERAGQTVSWPSWVFIAGASLGAIVQAIVCATGHEQWLNLLYYLSYVKLAVSCIKYFPQMYKNFRLKSTAGWSIGNVLLDLNGGALSLAQMFMQAWNLDDWASVFYNPTKFGMGALSIVFDLIFIVQHYILYSPRRLARLGIRPPPTYGSYDEVNGHVDRASSPTSLFPHNNTVYPDLRPPSSYSVRQDAFAPAATQLTTNDKV